MYVGGRRKDDKEAVGERRDRESEGLVDGWVWKLGVVEGGIGNSGGGGRRARLVQGKWVGTVVREVTEYSRYCGVGKVR